MLAATWDLDRKDLHVCQKLFHQGAMPGYRYMVEGQVFDSGQGLNVLFRAFGDLNTERDICVNVMLGKNICIADTRFPIAINFHQGTVNGCSMKYYLPTGDGFPTITVKVFVCERRKEMVHDEGRTTLQRPEKSEKRTRVGIQNEGNTCYINVVLQTMFHIPLFRKAIYETDPGTHVPDSENLIFQMQVLFQKLEMRTESASAANLIRSFGWNWKTMRQQQDLSEFWRLLMQKLETKIDSSIPAAKLFTGKMITTITCYTVTFRTEREEEFTQLVLNVDDEESLRSALDKYMRGEFLTGENKYMTPLWGPQEAHMTHKFTELPPVLQICLTRTVALNRVRFHYDENLILSIPKTVTYYLFGVHVRAGTDPSSGHYYTYLRLSMKDTWYKFNDSTVTEVPENEAMGLDHKGAYVDHIYMLIYVRNDWIAQLFKKIEPRFYSDRVDQFIEKEKDEERRRLIAENDRRNSKTFEIITDEKISRSSWNFDNLRKSMFIEGSQGGKCEYVKVQKHQKICDLYVFVAVSIRKDPDSFDLYFCTDNGRVGMKIERTDSTSFETYGIMEKQLYVLDAKYRAEEFVEATSGSFYLTGKTDAVLLVFLYGYWRMRRENPIHFIRPVLVKGDSAVAVVVKLAIEYYRLPVDTTANIYFANTKFTRVNEQATFTSMKILSGERIIIEFPDVENCPAPQPVAIEDDNVIRYTDYMDFPPFKDFPVLISSLTRSEIHYEDTFEIVSFPTRFLTAGELMDFCLEHVFHVEKGPHTAIYVEYEATPCSNNAKLLGEYRNRGKSSIDDFWIENFEHDEFSWRVLYWTSRDSINIDNIEPHRTCLKTNATAATLKEEAARLLSVDPETLRVMSLKHEVISEVLEDNARLKKYGNMFRVEPIPDDQRSCTLDNLTGIHIDYPDVRMNFLTFMKKKDRLKDLIQRVEGICSGINLNKAFVRVRPSHERSRKVALQFLLKDVRHKRDEYFYFRYRETDMDDIPMRLE